MSPEDIQANEQVGLHFLNDRKILRKVRITDLNLAEVNSAKDTLGADASSYSTETIIQLSHEITPLRKGCTYNCHLGTRIDQSLI